MPSPNPAFASHDPSRPLSDEFALLAALRHSEADLDSARTQLIDGFYHRNNQDSETTRLKLLLTQQKIARCTDDSPALVPKLIQEQNKLLAELRNDPDFHVFSNRAKLLEASVSNEARQRLFQELLQGLPLVARGSNSDKQGSSGTGYCPKGHLLNQFTTPSPKFGCDRCSNRFPQGVTMYGCRPCDFDLCPSCFEGNVQFSPVRPNLDPISIISATLLTPSSSLQEQLGRFSANTLGFLTSLTAMALFNPRMITPDLAALSEVVKTAFNPLQVQGRIALRGLLSQLSLEGAAHALGSSNDDGDALLQLLATDLQSGHTEEDQSNGLQFREFTSSSFYTVLSHNQIQRLSEIYPSQRSKDWYGEAILVRILPSVDEVDPQTFQYVASHTEKLQLLQLLQGFSKAMAPFKNVTSLDFLLLHHQVKVDRERRKSLLPNSVSADGARYTANVPLLLQYLNTVFRDDGPLAIAKPLDHHFQPFQQHSWDALSQQISPYFPSPSLSDDINLVRAELFELFSWKEASPKTFERYLNSNFVNEIYTSATVPSAPPVGAEASVKFCDFNAGSFTIGEPLHLYCDFKDVKGGAWVKLFEIDAKQLYRTTKREINTAIVLDGLVPHFEKAIPLNVSVSRYAREKITLLNDKPRSGCFVVEVVADGVASRVVVRKGAVRCAERREPYGHVFFPFEIDSRVPLDLSTQKVELWVDGKVYYPEATGETRIIVPYLPAEESYSPSATAVLTCSDQTGSRSHIFNFTRRSARYALVCSYRIPRESLVDGNRAAQLLVKPFLCVGDCPAPLTLLKDYKLVLTSEDAEGTCTEETFNVAKEELKQTIERTFRVVPKLAKLSCKLLATTLQGGNSVTADNSLNLSGLNGQAKSTLTCGLFLRPLGGSYELLVLGRSGEPIEGVPVQVSFTTEFCSVPITWNSRSDANGAIDLGDLRNVIVVQCTTKFTGVQRQVAGRFEIPKDTVIVRDMDSTARSLETDTVQLAFPLKSPANAVLRSHFGLVQLAANGVYVVRDCFANLTLSSSGTHVYVRGLHRGDYKFQVFDVASTTTIMLKVCAGGTGSPASSTEHALRLSPNGGRIFVADPVEAIHSVTIQQVDIQAETRAVRVQVSGGSTNKRRVHVLARNFTRRIHPTIVESVQQQLVRRMDEPVGMSRARALYVQERKLGDEIVYCMNRTKEQKQTGNMLPMPSQLLNEKDLGETKTQVFDAKEGTQIQSVADDVQMMDAREVKTSIVQPRMMSYASARPPPGAQSSGGLFRAQGTTMSGDPVARSRMNVSTSADEDPSMDFLASPASVLVNLVPDPQTGLVEFVLNPNVTSTWLEVIVTDENGSMAIKNVPLPSFSSSLPAHQQFLDLRHRLRFPIDAHVVETQDAIVVKPQVKFEIGNLSTAKFAVLDTFDAFFDFALAIRPSNKMKLQAMSFLKRWHTLGDMEKVSLYSSNACHELNFILKQRDRSFFDQVVRKQLNEKPQAARVFLDLYLLDQDLSAFADLGVVHDMNNVEKALLCVQIASTHPEIAKMILRQLKDASAMAEDHPNMQRLRAAAFMTAIQFAVSREATNSFYEAQQRQQPAPRPVMAGMVQGRAMGFGAGPQSNEQMGMEARGSHSKKGSYWAQNSRPVAEEMMRKQMVEEEVSEEEAAEFPAEEIMDDDYDDAYMQDVLARVNKGESRKLYKDLGPAHAWTETQFFDSGFFSSMQNATFWYEFALCKLGFGGSGRSAFIHRDFAVGADTTSGEVLMMLGVTDVPAVIEPPHRYDARRDVGELDFYPSTDCLVFLQQVRSASSTSVSEETMTTTQGSKQVLVVQSLFALDPSTGEVLEDREPLELLKRQPYISRVVLTNISNDTIKVKLLVQIPEGSLPLCDLTSKPGMASSTIDLQLQPFTTIKHFSTAFYFPQSGNDLAWFPAHVSKAFAEGEEEALLAFESPRNLRVVDRATVVDETSWAHICSDAATIDQVCTFIETQMVLKKVNFRDICWRFMQEGPVGKHDWMRIRSSLESRGIFVPEVYFFALKHGNSEEETFKLVSSALRTMQAYTSNCGPTFKSKLLTYDVDDLTNATAFRIRDVARLVEVFPLVNSRVHPLMSAFHDPNRTDPSPNVKVSQVHKGLMRELAFSMSPVTLEQRMRLVILLLTEGKVPLAQLVFFSNSSDRLLQTYEKQERTSPQEDYLAVYLAFFIDESEVGSSSYGDKLKQIATSALSIASRHKTHPNEKWRARFEKIAKMCRQLLGKSDEEEEDVVMTAEGEMYNIKRLKEETNQEKAAKVPSFEIELVDPSTAVGSPAGRVSVKVITSNVPAKSEFTVNVFKMNVEHLFSTKPFSVSQDASTQRDLGQFAFVLPNYKHSVVFDGGKEMLIQLPDEYINENVTIQVQFEAQQRVLSRFASSMRVNVVEDFGLLRVFKGGNHATGQQPIPLAYCKVYARLRSSFKPVFYKDGYTDVMGEFDYGAINTTRISDVVQFSVFVSHPQFGSVIRKVDPPVLS